MATDLERLVVQLSADIKSYERSMARAQGVTNREFNAIERRARQLNTNMSAIGARVAQSFVAPLAGIGAALGVQQIAAYADEWTVAGNKIASASEIAGRSARDLNAINDIANETRTGLTETVDLYSKLLRATKDVAESEEDVARATEIINKAFKAGGAATSEQVAGILQLGQALGSGVLQGDELRSIRENAPLVAQAIADEFKTTIGGLKELGAEGKITSDRVFRAILAAQEPIEAAFSQTKATIRDAVTEVNNEFLAYIGNADDSAGASDRLVAALQTLADNFEGVADTVVIFSTLLIGALTGRALVGVVGGLGNAVVALGAFLTALRAGTAATLTFRAALGPLGLILGAATAAALAFGDWTTSIDDATRALADQAASGDAVEGMIADVKRAQEAYKSAISATAGAQTSASNSIVADSKREFEAKKALLDLELKRQQALLAVQKADLAAKGAALKAEVGSQVFTRDSSVARGFSDPRIGDFVRQPDDITGLAKTREVIANSPITAEIERIRAEMTLTEIGARQLEEALNSTFSAGSSAGGGGGGGGDAGSSGTDGGPGNKPSSGGSSSDDFRREIDAVRARRDAILAETEAMRGINPLIDDYGFALEHARTRHELLTAAEREGVALTPGLTASIEALAAGYAAASAEANRLAEGQDEIRQRHEEWGRPHLRKDVVGGFISDLRRGTSETEALANALGKVSDKLIDIGLDMLLGGGNWLFGGPSYGGGGVAGFIASLLPFDRGGYTGPGGKYKPKGIVHAGEYVFSKEATDNIGPANLDAMHKAAKGFANGGYVAPSIPTLRAPRNRGAAQIDNSRIYNVDARGAQRGAGEEISAALQAYDAQLPARMSDIVERGG